VTRQFPKDVRSKYFIQTTPILWLSTVAGKDNMDPSKLSLLTDYLINFMEKSQNAVILIDGIEYLATSSDFSRTLRAIDRWTETAMASSTRLILSIDQRSFDAKEVAILERNREVVKPDAADKWRIIPEPV
jgi:two-component system cell cycle response regulator